MLCPSAKKSGAKLHSNRTRKCVVFCTATVLRVLSTNWWYHACSSCKKKATAWNDRQECSEPFCKFCRAKLVPYWRYRIVLLASDGIHEKRITLFGSALNKAFGVEAEKFVEFLQTSNVDFRDKVSMYFVGTPFYFGVYKNHVRQSTRQDCTPFATPNKFPVPSTPIRLSDIKFANNEIIAATICSVFSIRTIWELTKIPDTPPAPGVSTPPAPGGSKHLNKLTGHKRNFSHQTPDSASSLGFSSSQLDISLGSNAASPLDLLQLGGSFFKTPEDTGTTSNKAMKLRRLSESFFKTPDDASVSSTQSSVVKRRTDTIKSDLAKSISKNCFQRTGFTLSSGGSTPVSAPVSATQAATESPIAAFVLYTPKLCDTTFDELQSLLDTPSPDSLLSKKSIDRIHSRLQGSQDSRSERQQLIFDDCDFDSGAEDGAESVNDSFFLSPTPSQHFTKRIKTRRRLSFRVDLSPV